MTTAIWIACADCGVAMERRHGLHRFCAACARSRERARLAQWNAAHATARTAARTAARAERDARAPLARIVGCQPASGRAGFDVAYERLSDGVADEAYAPLGTAGAELVRRGQTLRLLLSGDAITEVRPS